MLCNGHRQTMDGASPAFSTCVPFAMVRPPSKVADEVASRGRGLTAYVARLDRQFAAHGVGRADLNRVYAGAFVSFATYVERSLERLFLGLVMGRFAASGIVPLVEIKSDKVAHAVVRGGRKYVDWLPYEQHTAPRAEAFFASGKPFTELGRPERRVLEHLGILRNAIAHESAHSTRLFRRTFVEGRALPVDQQTPAGYLRGQHSPGLSRFANTVNENVVVFRSLCGGRQ